MIDDAELPIEFWDEAVEYDSYIRNRLPLGPIINGKLTSPMEACTGVRPNIDHIRPWGYNVYGGRPRKDQKINEKEKDYTGEVMDGIQLTSQSINISVPIAATSALDPALLPNATPALISERESEKEQKLSLASVQEPEQIPAPSLSPVPTSISVEIPKPTGELKATGELIDVIKKKELGPKKKPKEKITNPKRRDLDSDLQSIAVNKMEIEIEHKKNEIETNDVDMKNEVETRNDEMENKIRANDSMKENQSLEVDESSKVPPILVAKIMELDSTVEAKPRYFFRNKKCGAHSHKFAVYTDADWATDKSARKSISGGVCLYYGGPISWSSKKQTSVATSSAEAEYISQAMYAKQGQCIAQILRDTRMQQFINEIATTLQMYGDNRGALALVKRKE
ncbi:hypothetical protein K3495_g4723 [Podosphaera aphanis]|nr:hypothetical protein K3495_g4723 [Podosphaera aphanis]